MNTLLQILSMTNWETFTLFVAETIATGMLMFIGCMSCISGDLFQPSSVLPGVVFGLTVMMIINIFGMVSGAHLNPSVTVAAVVYKLIPISTAVVYIAGQVLGACLGYAALRLLFGEYGNLKDNGQSFCGTLPNVGDSGSFFIEFVITSILIMVCCGVWDPRNSLNTDSVSIRFGFVVTCLSIVAGPYSGASMNPARSFAPALYNWNWNGHWIYWIAPLSASLMTSVAFRALFFKAPSAVPETAPLLKNNV